MRFNGTTRRRGSANRNPDGFDRESGCRERKQDDRTGKGCFQSGQEAPTNIGVFRKDTERLEPSPVMGQMDSDFTPGMSRDEQIPFQFPQKAGHTIIPPHLPPCLLFLCHIGKALGHRVASILAKGSPADFYTGWGLSAFVFVTIHHAYHPSGICLRQTGGYDVFQ